MTAVFAAAIFLSSALLFWLEPLFGKMVLPLLGGAPPTWNACVLFFQVALVVGYGWAHVAERIGIRRHLGLHIAVSAAALVALPLAVPESLLPPSAEHPLRWVLGALTVGAGLPFVVLAANGPLLQRAFSRSGAESSRDPYFLYAASNLGSAVSLLLYPVVFERYLTLTAQAQAWRVVYIALVAVLALCAVLFFRSPERRLSIEAVPGALEFIPWRRRLRWIALAAIPSSLMLGVTTYISSEVAPVPLIWILPLALYLATLVVAFAATETLSGWIRRIFGGAVTPRGLLVTAATAVVAGTVAAWLWASVGSRVVIVIAHLLLFTIGALICHTRLAADRPAPSHLTEYYLWMAIGGGLGGAFNTLLGPLLFTSVLEYPLALAAVLMVLPPRRLPDGSRPTFAKGDVLWPVAIGLVALAVPAALALSPRQLPFSPRLLLAVPALASLAFSGRPVRFGGALVAVVAASAAYPSEIGAIEHAERNFYSVHRVLRDDARGFRWLTHGVTVHGGQRLADSARPTPLTYYTPEGPAGDVFRAYAGRQSVGVIGLGAGALAYYGRPDERWTFFEIDPAVISTALDAKYFTYLSRALAPYRIVEGDARLSLARDRSHFDVLVLDAFASDAVPMHLLTREAIQLYQARLAPRGIMLMHISNRFFDLGPIVGVMAHDAGLVAFERRDDAPDDMELTGKFGSHWVVLARSEEDGARLQALPGWQPLVGGAMRPWTDDYSSVLPLLRRSP